MCACAHLSVSRWRGFFFFFLIAPPFIKKQQTKYNQLLKNLTADADGDASGQISHTHTDTHNQSLTQKIYVVFSLITDIRQSSFWSNQKSHCLNLIEDQMANGLNFDGKIE